MCVNLFIKAYNVIHFIVRDVNQYMVKTIYQSIVYGLDNDYSSSCIDKSLRKNTHISLNMELPWLT